MVARAGVVGSRYSGMNKKFSRFQILMRTNGSCQVSCPQQALVIHVCQKTLHRAPFLYIISLCTGKYKTAFGEYCPPAHDVTTEKDCRNAAAALGLTFDKSWYGPGDHRFCLFAEDGRNRAYFNTAGDQARSTPTPLYSSICSTSRAPPGLFLYLEVPNGLFKCRLKKTTFS